MLSAPQTAGVDGAVFQRPFGPPVHVYIQHWNDVQESPFLQYLGRLTTLSGRRWILVWLPYSGISRLKESQRVY